jgi:hypothetical protein
MEVLSRVKVLQTYDRVALYWSACETQLIVVTLLDDPQTPLIILAAMCCECALSKLLGHA